MMKKYIFLMLSTTIICTSGFTQEEQLENSIKYSDRSLACNSAEIKEEEEEAFNMLSERAFSFPYQLSNEMVSAVVRTIKSIDPNGSEITLDDNSVIRVSYWWRGKAKQWTRGDQLTLSFYRWNICYPRVGIDNLTRQETVWAEYFVKTPNHSPNTIVVKEILPKGLIVINREIILRVDNDYYEELYHYWSEGDQLEILLDPKTLNGSNVRVWNPCLCHGGWSIVFNVKVLNAEEAKAILN